MADLAALLFDLDGTLVDTAGANYRAYAAALAEAGCAVERDAFEAVAAGRHWSQFLPVLLPGADHAAIAARKQILYPAMLGETQVNTQLVGLARAVSGRLRLALVTNASPPSVEAVLAAHGLDTLFDTVVTGDDATNPKPAPDPYLLAMARLGVSPEQCLAFEDSDIGAESAHRARISVVRVTL
ncbi:HAD family phosphatase [Sphingomonas sp. AOB5]|uniref:HAD family hydrolase n=1 Tax=Sphingomonas sp. AOB5 TaxID=3034017 RepID=UPI0023F79E93|nr:HAD family phosphatase [Sphingomonas sp. AOB5]MDF7777390.1 HAD family phosphatase [Sphingomonas sp. AOB5]